MEYFEIYRGKGFIGGITAAISPSLLYKGGFGVLQVLILDLIIYIVEMLEIICFIHFFLICVVFLSDSG